MGDHYEEYDGQPLYPMLLKCYHYLYPMRQSRVGRAHQIGDAKFDLNLFFTNSQHK